MAQRTKQHYAIRPSRGNKMAVKIRPLEHADENNWRDLWKAYLAFYNSSVPDQVYKTTFARLLDEDTQEFNCFLATQNDTPIGLVHYLSHRHCWRTENVIYLQDLFVDPNQRGEGIGRQLIEAVYRTADENQTPSVYWLTQADNHDAQKLYDRLAKKTDFIKYQR